jgi:hypothetical protein
VIFPAIFHPFNPAYDLLHIDSVDFARTWSGSARSLCDCLAHLVFSHTTPTPLATSTINLPRLLVDSLRLDAANIATLRTWTSLARPHTCSAPLEVPCPSLFTPLRHHSVDIFGKLLSKNMESKLLRPGMTKESIRSPLFYPWHSSRRLPSVSAIQVASPRRVSSPTCFLVLESNLRATT